MPAPDVEVTRGETPAHRADGIVSTTAITSSHVQSSDIVSSHVDLLSRSISGRRKVFSDVRRNDKRVVGLSQLAASGCIFPISMELSRHLRTLDGLSVNPNHNRYAFESR